MTLPMELPGDLLQIYFVIPISGICIIIPRNDYGLII